jgi:hypothetical protein
MLEAQIWKRFVSPLICTTHKNAKPSCYSIPIYYNITFSSASYFDYLLNLGLLNFYIIFQLPSTLLMRSLLLLCPATTPRILTTWTLPTLNLARFVEHTWIQASQWPYKECSCTHITTYNKQVMHHIISNSLVPWSSLATKE